MFVKPCNGLITSLFDKARKNPVTGVVRPHWGIDYGNTPGRNDIFASAAGTVRIAVNSSTGFGKYIIITHNNGWETVYAHLASISVNPGQSVKQGQKIGVKGTTGNSTGVHLHFEISKGRWSNKYTYHVNPALYIDDPDVRELQSAINKLGHKLNVDGIYGDGTVKAVAAYQKTTGLFADGVAGRLTLAAINKSVKPVLIAQDTIPTKEVIRMFNPSSGTLKSEYERLLLDAVKAGTITDKWLTDFKAGKLSLDDALALKVFIDERKK